MAPSWSPGRWRTAARTSGWAGRVRAGCAWLRAECEAIGRDSDMLTLSVQVIIPAAGEERRAALEGAIAYGRAGASEILLTTPARDGAAGIRRLATEIATPLRDAFG